MAVSPAKVVRRLIAESGLCVLATASRAGTPEAAVMGYAADAEFNLYFETFPTYRKYSNLKSNPQASVVLTKLSRTLQMDGRVTELRGREAARAKLRIMTQQGNGARFSDPAIRFFRFKPSWIRVLVDPAWPPRYYVLRGRRKGWVRLRP